MLLKRVWQEGAELREGAPRWSATGHTQVDFLQWKGIWRSISIHNNPSNDQTRNNQMLRLEGWRVTWTCDRRGEEEAARCMVLLTHQRWPWK